MTKAKTQVDGLQCDVNQVSAGVRALLQYLEKKHDHTTLIDDTKPVHLQFCMKKVPRVKNKIIKCRLPHSLLLPTSDVCLFVRDLDSKNRDYAPTERHFQSLLEKNGVEGITKILPLKALKLEHQPYEAKRNLSNMYEVYLADANIVRLLPAFLGKNFYSRKKFPVQVNLDSRHLKAEFERALETSHCIIGGRGSTCQVTVAHSGLNAEQVIENIQTALSKISSNIPGGPTNIRNVHIKSEDSPAIPLYMSLGGPNDVTLPASRKRKLVGEPEEVSTVIGAKVRVTPEGHIRLIPDGEVENAEVRRKQYKSAKNKVKQNAIRKAAAKKLKKKAAKSKESNLVNKKSGIREDKVSKAGSKQDIKKTESSRAKAKTLKGKSRDKKKQTKIQQPKSHKMSKIVKKGKRKVRSKS